MLGRRDASAAAKNNRETVVPEAAKRAGFRRRLFGAELVRSMPVASPPAAAPKVGREGSPPSPMPGTTHTTRGGGGLDWLAEVVVRGGLYSAIGRVMRSLTLTEALIVAAIAVVAFMAYQRRA